MADYSKVTIYMITSRQTDNNYIGFTRTTLPRTKALFRQEYDKYVNGFVKFRRYFELMQYKDVVFRFIEIKSFKSRDEAKEYIRQLREMYEPPRLEVKPIPIIQRQRTVLIMPD